MGGFITLNETTQSLIDDLNDLEEAPQRLKYHVNKAGECRVKHAVVLKWLNETNNGGQARFLRESLRAVFLRDLHYYLLTADEKKNQQDKKTAGWLNRLLYALLAIAGTLFAICGGFDGVSSLLFLFTGVPYWLIFVVGFAFSAFSVAVFYGFDLVTISTNLDVEFTHARHLLDVLVEQAERIQQLRKQINRRYKRAKNSAELQKLQAILSMLIIRYDDLDEARKAYTIELNKSYLNVLKLAVGTIAGVLFFSYGFFSGQSMALAFVGLLGISTVSAFWPITIFGFAIGIAALSVYWFVERPGLENLVGRWLGLDKNKIEILAGSEIVVKQKRKLLELKGEIDNLQCKPARRLTLNSRRHPDVENKAKPLSLFRRRVYPDSLFYNHTEYSADSDDPCVEEMFRKNP